MEEEQNNNNNNNNALAKISTCDLSLSLLTLRMIMQGKEVGSIIGKKGDNVRRFREESGARINISDASCPERIVTITGTTDQIVSAFTMICRRLEEDLQNSTPGGTIAKQLITLRLIVPANQCGSLIGKGGVKIKEIRDVAGASIQISSEMLPNSTERTVTVSGSVESVTRGIYHICSVMLESPPKGTTIPYRPKIAMTPVILAGGQAYAMNGQYFIPQPDLSGGHPTVLQYHPVPQYAKMVMQQGLMGHAAAALSPYPPPQHAILAPSYQLGGFIRAPASQGALIQHTNQTHEISIPNDLIGCIIGRGGSKINEIRQASGANIKIAGVEEGSSMRMVTISGPPEAINAAQYLINASLEMHRNMTLTLDLNTYPSGSLASSGASMSSSELSLPPPPPPLSSGGDDASSVVLPPQAAFVGSVDFECLDPSSNSAPGSMSSVPSLSLIPRRTLPPAAAAAALNSHGPGALSTLAFLRPTAGSNPNLPQTPSVQFNPLTFTPQPPPSFTIPVDRLIKPIPVLNGFIGAAAALVDPQRNLATKMRGGFCLASAAAANKFGQKYSPY